MHIAVRLKQQLEVKLSLVSVNLASPRAEQFAGRLECWRRRLILRARVVSGFRRYDRSNPVHYLSWQVRTGIAQHNDGNLFRRIKSQQRADAAHSTAVRDPATPARRHARC